MGKLFGTDGVRGVANTQLTSELSLNLGRAGAYVLTRENAHTPQILIGRDTRISGVMLESAMTAGMCSLGALVYPAEVIPTPGVAYLVRKYKLDAGVMISASHNPVQDNGIKFFSGNGYKLPDALENEIEDVIEHSLDTLPRPTGLSVGVIKPCENAVKDYEDFLVASAEGIRLDGLKIALDCANGATSAVAPSVFKRLGADVMVIHNTPDGTNINLDCGSTHMDSLVEFVKANKANMGFAYDGDGDRCLAVDENGKIIDGDEIMSICGKYLYDNGQLAQNTIVATVMSNLGFIQMGERLGINIETTNVGDRYVLERMLEGGFKLGGEQSGHVIFLDHNTTGDGILTSLMVAKTVKQSGKTLSEVNCVMEVLPQALVNARVSPDKKSGFANNEKIKLAVEALERKFAGNGRVLIRPSGTEPIIRVMIEGKDKGQLESEAKTMARLLEEELG